MATLSSVLSQIRSNESGSAAGNYTLTPQQNYAYPASHASGAYQFEPATWQSLTQRSGIGTQYSEAYQAPANVQDAVAAYALEQNPNPNSSSLWQNKNYTYPQVTSYDVSSQQLASGSSLGGGTQTASNTSTPYMYEGYDQNGTYVGGTSDPSQYPIDGATTYTPVYQSPTGTGSGSGTATTGTQSTSGLGSGTGTQSTSGLGSGSTGTGSTSAGGTTSTSGSTAGNAALLGTEQGYTPPASTGGPSTVGLSPGVANQVNTIATNAVNTFTNATGGWLSDLENELGRFGLIIVGIVILLVALWRIMDPSGEKTRSVMHGAMAAA